MITLEIQAAQEWTPADSTLLAALFGSILVGLDIVASDAYLRAAAPTHAYGLAAFSHAGTVTIILAVVQLVAMGGDLAGLTLPTGVQGSGFTNCRLSGLVFMMLLSLQPAIAYLAGTVEAERRY